MTIAETREAARLLRVLAAAEIARLEGDDDDESVRRLLDSVDPVDARRLADSLDFDASVRALYRRTSPTPELVERIAAYSNTRKVW